MNSHVKFLKKWTVIVCQMYEKHFVISLYESYTWHYYSTIMLFGLKNWPLCLSTLSDKKYIFEWMKSKNGADVAQIRRQCLNQAVALLLFLCFALLYFALLCFATQKPNWHLTDTAVIWKNRLIRKKDFKLVFPLFAQIISSILSTECKSA